MTASLLIIYIFSHPVINVMLSIFFNCCLHHTYLPEALLRVILVPLVKEKNGDVCDISNYRPVALSTILSKILEVIILNRCTDFLGTSDNQFAYKPNHGTEMSITMLKHITLEYSRRSTPVYTCFMDMSKAFDKVCHSYLFNVMKERGVPDYIINILQNWYTNQIMNVRWGDAVSSDFHVSCGVKQGSVLSPYLFNIYMDNLSDELSSHKIGCIVNDQVVNHNIYADDIALFSPSMSGLQKLVNVCNTYMTSMKLSLNANKTKCVMFNHDKKIWKPQTSITINNTPLEFVKEKKYLGYMFTFNNSDDLYLRSLYRSLCIRSNMILRNFSKCVKDVKSLLFKSFCTSFYCLALVFKHRISDINKLKVCYNNSFRRFFNVSRRTSVSAHFVQHGIPTFMEAQRKAVVSLLGRLRESKNRLLSSLVNSSYFHTTIIFSQLKK